MRIFWHSGNQHDPLKLLLETAPARPLCFPTEIVKKIISYLPRSCLPVVTRINRSWYMSAMPILYRHIYICTLPHWILLLRTFEEDDFAASFGHYISSLVLKPSPTLISSQLTSALNINAIENDDILQPYTRGYVRFERVNYDLTGLEDIQTTWSLEDTDNINNRSIDTSSKEAEWLSSVTDEQVESLLRFSCNLEYLDLSGCENLSDRALVPVYKQKLNNTVKNPTQFKGLWLNLLRNITTTSIANLALVDQKLGYSQLKYLDLEFVVSLNDTDVEILLKHFGPSLSHLKFNSAYELTNESAASISAYCPNLRLLYLTRCWKIDNKGLIMLSKHCRNIQYLSVSFLSNVNDEGLAPWVHNRNLIWLNITGCGINTLFKQLILNSWEEYRTRKYMPCLLVYDEKLNLI